MSIANIGRDLKGDVPALYHISLDGDLEGFWEPGHPSGGTESLTDEEYEELFSEPSIPRVSVSPTIEGCFRGVYPNMSKLMEVKKQPYVDFFAYSPVLGKVRILTNAELTKRRYVHDAHVTLEHWITERVRMKLVGVVRVYNTVNTGGLLYRPYNLKKLEPIYHSPKEVRFTWMD